MSECIAGDGQPERRPLRATVSGSFTESINDVQQVVQQLNELGVEVISPADPRPVERFADFVYVASDIQRTVRILQDRHFTAIERSDLLWVCTKFGGLGESTTAEIHHANMFGVPVFADEVLNSVYWRQTVTAVRSVDEAVLIVRTGAHTAPIDAGGNEPHLLLDPIAATDLLHADVEASRHKLIRRQLPLLDDPELWALLRRIRRTVGPARSVGRRSGARHGE